MSEEKKVIPCDGAPDSCHGDSEKCDKDPAVCLSNSSFVKKEVDSEMDDCLGRSLDQLSNAFINSAKRWEMIVYPAMFSFIVLATYGFFLIYSLTTDLHTDVMTKNIVVMTQTMDGQAGSMREMTYQMKGMNQSIGRMGHDFSVLNNSVSRPMSFMNTFMPW